MKSKHTFILSTLLIISCISISVQFSSGEINQQDILSPQQTYTQSFKINNMTEYYAERTAANNLIYLLNNEKRIDFESEGPLSIFLLNETEMASFIIDGSFTPQYMERNITSLNLPVNFDEFVSTYGFESYLKEDPNEEFLIEEIIVYIIILNEHEESYQFSLRFDYNNYYFEFFDEFFKHLMFFSLLGFGLKLIFDGMRRKEENKHQSHMMKGYGLAFVLGGIATLAWQIFDYYEEANPDEAWKNLFLLDIGSPIFGKNILSFVTFFCLGFSIVFLSNTVERNVQNKKIPYFTYTLIFAEGLFIVAMLIPSIALFIVYAWILILLITGFNIVFTYVNLIKSSTGIIRKKSFWILLGLFLTYISLAIRNFILPDMIANGAGIIFVIVSYYAIKMN